MMLSVEVRKVTDVGRLARFYETYFENWSTA